jgi:hypothetical protein
MMQKSMIVFMVLGISLVHVPHSFSMERPPRVPTEVRFAKCEAEMQRLGAENQALSAGLLKLKEESGDLILLCKESEAIRSKLLDTNRKYFYGMVSGWSVAVVAAISMLLLKHGSGGKKRATGEQEENSLRIKICQPTN